MALTDAMVALYSTTLAAATSSVTIAGIPATGYRDLQLIVNGKTTGALNNLQAVFNGDTGTNYFWVRMLGDGSSASSSSSNQPYLAFGDIGTLDTSILVSIADYSQTDKHKSTLTRAGNAASGGVVSAYAGRWASTAAINSIKLTAGAGNLDVGLTISLFGIKA